MILILYKSKAFQLLAFDLYSRGLYIHIDKFLLTGKLEFKPEQFDFLYFILINLGNDQQMKINRPQAKPSQYKDFFFRLMESLTYPMYILCMDYTFECPVPIVVTCDLLTWDLL